MHPPHPPPPEQPPRFLRFGVGGAVVIILISVVGTCARIQNAKTAKTRETKREALPAVGSQGTLARAGTEAKLCPVGKNAFNMGWPCRDAIVVPAESRVRIMKADVRGTDALCRFWVQSGPRNDASGDAPCEWFVAE